jgi:hypothetical protein
MLADKRSPLADRLVKANVSWGDVGAAESASPQVREDFGVLGTVLAVDQPASSD